MTVRRVRHGLVLLVGGVLLPALLTLGACSPNVTPDSATVDVGTTGIPVEPDDTTLSPDTTVPPVVTKVALTRTLNKGDTGDDVLRMQQRLKDLAFDPGKLDGIYGDDTAESVWAYKSLIVGERWDKDLTSKVTPEVWDRMQDPLGWAPRKTVSTPRHVEVLLPEQVAVVVSDGQIRLITHVSTGSRKQWCLTRRPPPKAPGDTTDVSAAPQRYCGTSITPGGVYKVWAKRTGIFQGYYGDLYNATFFNGGLAIHGFDSVPYYPDSHGCVRIPNHIADYFQSLVRVGDQVFVFDGVTDPEVLGPVPPPDDVASTTTSPSTTSTTSTTVKPTTTAKAATTTTKAPGTTPPAAIATPATTPATTAVVTVPAGTSTTAA